MIKNDTNKYRLLRKAAGFKSQRDLADYLYCHVNTVISWETGNKVPAHVVELHLRLLAKVIENETEAEKSSQSV